MHKIARELMILLMVTEEIIILQKIAMHRSIFLSPNVTSLLNQGIILKFTSAMEKLGEKKIIMTIYKTIC